MTRCLHRWSVIPPGVSRRCLDCGRVEILPENAEPWDPPPSERLRAPEWYPAALEPLEPVPHAHDWIYREAGGAGGVTWRECSCGHKQVQTATGEYRSGPVPHAHDWERIVTTMDGDQVWRCRACGVRETRTAGVSLSESKPTLIEEHGGIVSYDRRTELITTGDGTSFTVEALMSVNPGISMTNLTHELERVERKRLEKNLGEQQEEFKKKIEALTRMTTISGAGVKDFAEALGKLSTAVADMPSVSRNPPPRRWTSDDALTLILQEIKHAPDPMKAAGEWITKMTNAITGIIRDLDDEQ